MCDCYLGVYVGVGCVVGFMYWMEMYVMGINYGCIVNDFLVFDEVI